MDILLIHINIKYHYRCEKWSGYLISISSLCYTKPLKYVKNNLVRKKEWKQSGERVIWKMLLLLNISFAKTLFFRWNLHHHFDDHLSAEPNAVLFRRNFADFLTITMKKSQDYTKFWWKHLNALIDFSAIIQCATCVPDDLSRCWECWKGIGDMFPKKFCAKE